MTERGGGAKKKRQLMVTGFSYKAYPRAGSKGHLDP